MAVTCPACGAEHSVGRRFCTGCGVSLTAACPGCGAAAAPGEHFCGECGQQLRVPAPTAPSRTATGDGERKWVSVLFADMADSMGRAEGLDPEEWAGLMDRLFSACAEAVAGAGGTVDKFTGDGIMAVFGAPVAQEDHARRACRAALRLVAAARELDLPMRVGINSGEVVAGAVGDQAWGERTALGHTVGLAQRMEGLAEIGGVCLSERTARLVAGHFELSDRGSHVVKGASRPVGVFALVGPRSRPAGIVAATTALVGREGELAELEEALRQAEAGRAQVVGVVGEAGVGKSRLSEEFAQRCLARGVTVRRTAGLSHATDVPLVPVVRLLRDAFGVAETDGPENARDKIARRVMTLDPVLADGLPVLFDFLEVPDPERPARLSPEARNRQVFAVLRQVTERRSEREVLVLLLEDLHWFDPASRAFLDELVPTFPGTRTLVLANFRPEFQAAWTTHSYYRQLPLAPLAPAAAQEFIDGLVGCDSSLATLPEDLQARTGGNPFFIEEVVRSLVEDGTLAGEPGAYRLSRPLAEARVPETVHAVLAARIDRLAASDKQVLGTAAVIGRNFAVPVLERVVGEAVDLNGLCAAQFLQVDGEDGYRFWHPLTQEVAYRSLLTPRRRALHGAVARALVEVGTARLDEQSALIAGHFAAAGEGWHAAQWEHRAAQRAQRRDFAEATQRWRAVLDHLATVEPSEEALMLELRTRIPLLRTATWAGLSPDEREAIFAGGIALVERLDDKTETPLLYASRAMERWSLGLLREAVEASAVMVDLAERHPRPDVLAITAIFAATGQLYGGSARETLRFSELAVARTQDDPDRGAAFMGCSPHARGLHTKAQALTLMGRPGEARAALDRSVSQIRERGEVLYLPFVLPWYVHLSDLTGDDHRAEDSADEAIRIVEQAGIRGLMAIPALEAHALAALLAGRHEDAARGFALALTEARRHGAGLFLEADLLAHLSRARLELGDHDSARAAAAEAVEVARRQGARILEVQALLARGRACGQAADLHAALTLAQDFGAIVYQPLCHEQLARLEGDRDALAGVADRFNAVGATGHARRIEADVAE